MISQARTSGFGKLLGVGVLGALVWFTHRGQKQAAKDDGHSAAFSDGETHPDAASPTCD